MGFDIKLGAGDDVSSAAPSRFATKTGALEPTVTAALIGVGGGILNTLFGSAMAPKPKKQKHEFQFTPPEELAFHSNLSDPGQSVAPSFASSAGIALSARQSAADRLRARYREPQLPPPPQSYVS